MKYKLIKILKNNSYLLQYLNTKKEAEKEAIRCLKYGDHLEDYTKKTGFASYEIEKVEIWKEYKNHKAYCIRLILKSMVK